LAFDRDPQAEHRALEEALLRQHDGAERVARLPCAQFVVVSPGTRARDPVFVEIVWSAQAIEHPIPGSTLWRAVLADWLLRHPSLDPVEGTLRAAVEQSLARWPDLETWWHWLRTGWTAPPSPRENEENGRRAEPGSGWRWPW